MRPFGNIHMEFGDSDKYESKKSAIAISLSDVNIYSLTGNNDSHNNNFKTTQAKQLSSYHLYLYRYWNPSLLEFISLTRNSYFVVTDIII